MSPRSARCAAIGLENRIPRPSPPALRHRRWECDSHASAGWQEFLVRPPTLRPQSSAIGGEVLPPARVDQRHVGGGFTVSIYGSSLGARPFGAVSGNACAHCGSGMTVVTSCLVLRAISMGSVPELSRIWTVSRSSHVSRRFAHAAVQRLLTSASSIWCPLPPPACVRGGC